MTATILVPVDTSTLAQRALGTACAIAKAQRGDLRLILVHETEEFEGLPDSPWNGAREAMECAYLDDKARQIEMETGLHVIVDHPKGPPAQTIVRHANAYRADLVVMSTHCRTGIHRAWMRSVADYVMRHVDIPVLMLRDGDAGAPTEFRRVLIPLDGTERAESIIDDAISVCGPEATYVLTRIVAPLPLSNTGFVAPFPMSAMPTDAGATEAALEAAREYLRETADRMRAKGAVHVHEVPAVSEDTPAAILSQKADLIAIASHGRGASRFVLGSVTDELLKKGMTPLLVKRVHG
jgi:nucleotide-binding universal stress UspA family protein